ncbi:MAG: glycosyl hydrolase family 28-related protein [Bacteroidales bacterium]|nr:glycosyl hydrolase family 28-related protein [Bacteroidales bacterium]
MKTQNNKAILRATKLFLFSVAVGLFSTFNVDQIMAASSEIIFNVRTYGAVGDGKNLDSPAIDKALDAAAKAGGGTVLVPAGIYLSGSIHLQSNIHLVIDVAPPYWELRKR